MSQRCCPAVVAAFSGGPNLKTSFSGTFHSLRFEKYAARYLGAFCYRFNRRFHLEEMTGRILRATCNCNARPERILRGAELAT